MDKNLQARLENLAAERASLVGPRASLAILVADHETGEVLAEVGSAGLFADGRAGHVDMVHAVRSPGSTLALIYGLAFESRIAHPETLSRIVPSASPAIGRRTLNSLTREPLRSRSSAAVAQRARRILRGRPARLTARLRRAGLHRLCRSTPAPVCPLGLRRQPESDELVRLFGIARGGSPLCYSAS